jgi:hypothetical protein
LGAALPVAEFPHHQWCDFVVLELGHDQLSHPVLIAHIVEAAFAR